MQVLHHQQPEHLKLFGDKMQIKNLTHKYALYAIIGVVLSLVPTKQLNGSTGTRWDLGWPSDCCILKHGYHWSLEINLLAFTINILTWLIIITTLRYLNRQSHKFTFKQNPLNAKN